MRRLLLIFLLLNVLEIHAQTDSLTVHVAGRPLADLLTDEQKQKVNYLFITGTLADEDYAFLRENNLPKLHELNLRKADIDTIPKKAFYDWDFSHVNKITINRYQQIYGYIILPEGLVCVEDSAFMLWAASDIILTGPFPKMGNDVFELGHQGILIVSEDNPYCKLIGRYSRNQYIISMDGKTFLLNQGLGDEIPEGVEVIGEKSFSMGLIQRVVFPRSLKEIKDYAFYNCEYPHPLGLWHSYYGEFVFQIETPPVLGKEVFGGDRNGFFYDALLTVPERCYENYINADEQWKVFKKDKSELSIEGLESEVPLQIKKGSAGWQISCESPIRRIQLYNVSGALINQTLLKGATEHLIPYPVVVTPCIMRVLLDDGNEFTVKL